MDAGIVLLLSILTIGGVFTGSVLLYEWVNRRWDAADNQQRMEAAVERARMAERQAESARLLLETKTQRIEQANIRADEAHDRVTALEQQVASLKSQLSLSSTARR